MPTRPRRPEYVPQISSERTAQYKVPVVRVDDPTIASKYSDDIRLATIAEIGHGDKNQQVQSLLNVRIRRTLLELVKRKSAVNVQ